MIPMMPPLPKPMHEAVCVVTMSARHPGVLVRVGIYSSPAEGITHNLRDETLLNGPRVTDRSYAAARSRLLRLLATTPNLRWLYDALPERDRP